MSDQKPKPAPLPENTKCAPPVVKKGGQDIPGYETKKR